ncbi:hypothetical protein [Mesorhizobium denitrificans]|uniref:Uncharacterized protein n=1 Tax=Mesorhizobium denitrificans TaxID=2294114 RepID=A0A371X688_9HYPH|nr:hypothetical protein [Mesorhizobium denitrificans]RFC64748.1 hypothetical protein DY251_18450 [Mesorhizobium denitrificans]
MIEIVIYPMKNTPDGGATLCEPPEDPDSYDVVVHSDDGTSLAETEDLPSYDEAIAAVDRFLLEFPRADVNYGDF